MPTQTSWLSRLGDRFASGRSTLAGAFGIMIAAVTLGSALNYLYSIIMTRMLGESGEFASFNSLNAIFLMVTMGALAVQTVVTKYVAEFETRSERDKTRTLIRYFSKWLIVVSAVVMLVSLAAAWPLARVLKLDSPLFVVIVGTSVALSLYLTLPYGLLQGQQRFIGLGTAGVAYSTLRITFGVALVALGLGVYGALGAATLSAICVTGVIVYYYRDVFTGRKGGDSGEFHPGKAFLTLIPVTVGIFLVIFMTQIDVVLVKALKSAALADRYSYGALAGKAVLFFPAGIYMVMFPRVSELRARGEPTRRVLAWSLLACFLLVGLVVGFYGLFPDFTARFFAGGRGSQIAVTTGPMSVPFVVMFGLVMAVFALLNVLVYYHLALDRRAFLGLLMLGAAAEVAGILLFHETLTDVLMVMLVTGAVLLIANLALAFVERPASEGGAGTETGLPGITGVQ